jgi:RNA polymerase sigma-70 factor, ECF subfamily
VYPGGQVAGPDTTPRGTSAAPPPDTGNKSRAAAVVRVDKGSDVDDAVQFQELALKYLDSLYNYGRLLTRDDTDAEDLLQETLLRGFRHRATLDPALNPKAWLFRVMRNAHIDRCRGRSARPSEVAFANGDGPDHGGAEASELRPDLLDPEEILLRRVAIAEVRDAIRQLPPVLREAVELREIEGLSYREIAAVIGRPIGTVMSRLARGRNHLRAILQAHHHPFPPERSRGM